MKKIISILLIFSVVFMNFYKTDALSNDMQGAWITTVYNSDWPKNRDSIEEQKKEMITLLDNLKDTGINTIMFQVRTQGDALYKSSINPWSSVLTGTQGKDPGYDPLKFVIDEAHKRGIKVHAWLNPYRVTTSGTNLELLSPNHQARKNPSWVLTYNNRLYFNPELMEVKNHIVDTVAEIVKNYDVDGIHFDDYFYPSNYPLPEGETKDGIVANNRRAHITQMVSMVKEKIKSIDKDVLFGISPSGIWKNKYNDVNGSNTNGNESYYSDYADTRLWVKNNMVDYIVPQIYWETGHKSADYETLVKWWNDVVSGTNVDLYIGQGIYKNEVATQIDTQLNINEKYNYVSGSIYYSSIDILNNREGAKDKIKKFISENNLNLTDINGNWAESSIRNFIDKGYISGYKDKTFRPNNNITRAEFVKIFNRINDLTNTSNKVFEDTKNHWAKEEIDIAVTNGVANGVEANKFEPDKFITREEAATMIANYKKIADSNIDKLNNYKDGHKVSDWAKPSVEGNIENGYIGGYSDNTIRPKNNLTRAEAVVILERIMFN